MTNKRPPNLTFVYKVQNVSHIISGYKILTLTYREVPTQELEQLVLPTDESGSAFEEMAKMKEALGLDELFYLSTCNRVLFFYYSDQPADTKFQLRFFRQINPQLTESQFENMAQQVRILEGEQALNHLFEIAASIDSMVVGEREILRQLRTAYEACAAEGFTGDYIRLAIQEAVRTAKQIYSDTRIGEKPVSIVSLAIQSLLALLPARNQRIVLLGAGQTMGLICKFLHKHQFENVTVFNRTPEKASNLAAGFNGKAYSLDEIPNFKEGFDILITCTGHSASWIDQAMYKSLLAGEEDKKIVVDLAIPTNLQKDVLKDSSVDYIQVDDLRKTARKNLSFREQEVESAQKIILEHHETFRLTLQQRKLEKALQTVPSQIKDIKVKAFNEVFKKDLDQLDEKSMELVVKMMDYMEKKCISIPMKAAKTIVK